MQNTVSVSEMQKERRRRGLEFQAQMIAALHRVPGAWVYRLPDRGNESPGDALMLTECHNYLIEIKRVAGDRFKLSALRPNQIHGLLAFAAEVPHNVSLLALKFDSEFGGAFLVEFERLMDWFREQGRASVTADEIAVHRLGAEMRWVDGGWDAAAALQWGLWAL